LGLYNVSGVVRNVSVKREYPIKCVN